MISNKTVSEDLNLKFRSNFNPGFMNRGILKVLNGFMKKETTRQDILDFFFKMFEMRSFRSWKCLKIYRKFTRVASWIN